MNLESMTVLQESWGQGVTDGVTVNGLASKGLQSIAQKRDPRIHPDINSHMNEKNSWREGKLSW